MGMLGTRNCVLTERCFVARTSTALIWNMARVIGQSGLGIIAMVVLARMLEREDFGVITMSLVFILFSEIVASVAFSAAIVQREELTEEHIDSGITMSLILATVFFVLFQLIADPVGEIYNSPVLAEVVKALTFGMWAMTASSVFRGLIMREMNFRHLMIIDFVTYALGIAIVAIVLVYMGWGVWGYVIGTLVWMLTSSIWLFFSVKRKTRLSLHAKEAKDLFAFGSGVSLNNIINFVTNKSIEAIVGRVMGMPVLGDYNRASTTAAIPFQKIAVTISSVMLVSYSQVQNDMQTLRERYFKAIRLISALSVPVLVGLYASGEYVITGMYGEKWMPAVEVFKILCIAGILNNILHLAGAVVQATGQIYREVRRQAFVAMLTLGSVWYAAGFSLEAVGWAYVFIAFVLYLLMAQLSLSIVGGSWRDYLVAQFPAITISVPVFLADYAAAQMLADYPELSREVGLLVMIGVSGFTYLACLALIPDRWIGGVRTWVMDTYGHRFPEFIRGYGYW